MYFPAWAALGLLFVEYGFFSAAFDSEPLSQRTDSWGLAGPLGWLAVLVVCAAAGVAIAANADRLGRPSFLIARRVDKRAAAALAAHALAIGALWRLSARIFSPEGPPAGPPLAWLSSWGLSALLAVLSALAAALPRGSFWPLAKSLWPTCGGGAVIGVGAWVAGQSSALLWWPLGPVTLRAVELSLNTVLERTVSDPSRALIGSERFQVVLAPVCSGFEGVGLMAVFVGAYLVLARRQLRFPQALLLLPLGLCAAWFANVTRLVLLILVGTAVSEEVAAGGFHARAGWLFFCGVALSLVLLVQRARFFAREPTGDLLDHPTAAYLLPFLVMVATSLLTGLATRHLDVLYGVRVLAAVAVLVAFRRFYHDIRSSWSWSTLGAGLIAAGAFVGLAPRPDPEMTLAWQGEWLALPAWGQLSWLLLRVVGSVLVVPLAEELAFRGYLQRRLIARDFVTVSPGYLSLWALLVSSAAFGAIHRDWVGATIAGLLFGIVQIRGNNVGHAVAAHVVSNAAIAAYVLGFRQWWLWV